jgi:hypothetical protein
MYRYKPGVQIRVHLHILFLRLPTRIGTYTNKNRNSKGVDRYFFKYIPTVKIGTGKVGFLKCRIPNKFSDPQNISDQNNCIMSEWSKYPPTVECSCLWDTDSIGTFHLYKYICFTLDNFT